MDVGVRLRLREGEKIEENENEAGVHCAGGGRGQLYFDPEL